MQKKRLYQKNAITEPLHHLDHKIGYTHLQLQFNERSVYPWEKKFAGKFPKITREHFYCNGSDLNPEKKVSIQSKELVLRDCMGSMQHGLPIRDREEFIYPILIHLLNYVQEKMDKRVIITCGHRCPEHNKYADQSSMNIYSKHQIGAEVDFYVDGAFDRPHEVVKWIMDYYQKETDQAFKTFKVCQKNPRFLKHPGWFNKEIIVKIQERDEGRDFDNRHPYPYITIELRYDRDRDLPVVYEWKKAQMGYLRKY